MKLILCTKCGDVVSLRRYLRTCSCGHCSGRYVDDISAEVSLSSIVLGIVNSSLLSAVVVDQKTYGDLVAEVPKAPPGRRFEAFIIPYSAQTVRRVEGLSALTCALRGASPLT